jgi:hypothetical protein
MNPVAANRQADVPSPSACDFVTILGSSYVRSFAVGTRFLPLMIGPGKSLSFLTDELAAVTRRITLKHAERVDPRSLVLLVYGNGDAQNHFRDDFGTRAAVDSGALPSHEHVIRTAARRYLALVDEMRARFGLNVAVFCAAPMLKPEMNRFVEFFNDELRQYAARTGVPLLDLTEALTDPETLCLKAELRAGDEDAHVNHELVPLVEQGLERLGMLPRGNQDFQWEYMFRFPIDAEVESKIWSEPYIGPGNILHSRKVMFSQIAERALHILVGQLAGIPGGVLHILNGREGFTATSVPAALAKETISLDVQDSKAVVGRRIADLLNRQDIAFRTTPHLAAGVADLPDADVTFMTIHETDDVDAALEAIAAAVPRTRQRILVLAAADIKARLDDMPGVGSVTSLALANRLTTGHWAKAQLYALTPS